MRYINIHSHSSKNVSVLDSIEIYNTNPMQDFVIPHLAFSAGIHPWDAENKNIDWYLSLLQKLIKHENCIAVGECGLDYSTNTNKQLQQTLFKHHINLSESSQLPLIIHCVRAFHDLLAIRKALSPSMPWIIHGFTRKEETALQCINSGMYISFGSAILRKQETHPIEIVPKNKLFLETDTTDIDISEIYQNAAKLMNLTTEELCQIIEVNFKSCFTKMTI